MELSKFLDNLLEAAKASGMEAAQVYGVEHSSFRARATAGELNDYNVSSFGGVGLRGVINGKMGYAGTQAFDEEAIGQMINGVLESAELNEEEEQDEIYAGDAEYPQLLPVQNDIASVSAEEKLAACMQMNTAACQADPRIDKVQIASVSTTEGSVYLRNTYGLNLHSSDSVGFIYCAAVAKDGDSTTSGGFASGGHLFRKLDPDLVAREAAKYALDQLHASPVPSGTYRIVLDREAMSDLLGTFCGVFSAECVQQQLSLLGGKEGTVIASPMVTLVDDPLLPGGWASSSFDAEGSACFTKQIINKGVLETLLHDRKTATKQGVKSTGNAGRGGYSGPVHVVPSNLFLQPTDTPPQHLLEDMGDGLLITEVSGLHAGANPISGDFSLLSKGFLIEKGQKVRPVDQITVAGNFYELLKNIRAVANDLRFDTSSISCPTVDAGEMTVSGS